MHVTNSVIRGRRRKAKCVFDVGNSRICIGCGSRGLECRSQTIATESENARDVISADDKASTGDLADRLARLERLIATLASSGSSGSSLTAGGPASIVIESSFTSFPQNNSGH